MVTIRVKSELIIGLAIVALSALGATSLLGQRAWHQGDTWMKWSRESRENFVFGYTSGYSTAYGNVCRRMAIAPDVNVKPGHENLPMNVCLQGQLDFSKGTEYFVNNITEFYKQYPGDRDIYIYEVVEQLADNLSLEQIHNHPFPRRTTGGWPSLFRRF
jgi:hypothetical protein